MHLKSRLSLKQKLGKKFDQKLLPIIQFGDQNSEMLFSQSLKIISHTQLLQSQIESAKITAAENNACSLSMPQIGLLFKIFLIFNKSLIDNEWFSPRYINSDFYDVYINPKITEIIDKKITIVEEHCQSFPVIKAKCLRYEGIKIEYCNQQMDYKEEILHGFKARIFQHELDHLQGINIMDWKINQGLLGVEKNQQKQFPYLMLALNEYRSVIDKHRQENPAYQKIRSLIELNNPVDFTKKPNFERESMYKMMRFVKKDLAQQQKILEKQPKK